jgi:C1A family cysteine protease
MMTAADYGLGWQKSLPDFRDYTPETLEVRGMLDRLGPGASPLSQQPTKECLASFFPAINDQKQINACSAQACVDLVHYFDRRALGRTVPLSKLFVYQATRRLLCASGNIGVDLRTTLKAIVAFGIPYEQHWPYDLEKLNEEPVAFLYAFADRYRGIRYLRLDGRNCTGRQTLATVKSFLNAGFPSVFGFSVPGSISNDADIPYRPTFDNVQGGQAVVAVGYDDQRISSTKGALKFRNSWGDGWGEKGYGWLPYAYIEEQLAADFWTIISQEWFDSDEFVRPRLWSLAKINNHSATELIGRLKV